MEEIHSEEIRYVMLFYYRKGKTATETCRKICNVYGENVTTVSYIQKWFRRFRDSNFNVKNGRPPSEHAAAIIKYTEENPNASCREIARALNISHTTVWKHREKSIWSRETGDTSERHEFVSLKALQTANELNSGQHDIAQVHNDDDDDDSQLAVTACKPLKKLVTTAPQLFYCAQVNSKTAKLADPLQLKTIKEPVQINSSRQQLASTASKPLENITVQQHLSQPTIYQLRQELKLQNQIRLELEQNKALLQKLQDKKMLLKLQLEKANQLIDETINDKLSSKYAHGNSKRKRNAACYAAKTRNSFGNSIDLPTTKPANLISNALPLPSEMMPQAAYPITEIKHEPAIDITDAVEFITAD